MNQASLRLPVSERSAVLPCFVLGAWLLSRA
jgi:hypothetical protein